MADHPYTATEVDAAVEALREPDRLARAQEVVTHAAPSLQGVLGEALASGGWFAGPAEAEVAKAAATEDSDERQRAVRILVAEETRLGMLVGVAVGFELAHELQRARSAASGAIFLDPTSIKEEDP